MTMTNEEVLERIRAKGGIAATCYCKGLPPARAVAWNDNEESPSFGVTPLMLPPPHDVLVVASWDESPFAPHVCRVEVLVFGPEDCQHPMLTFKRPEHAMAFVEQLVAVTDEAWADEDEAGAR
ncbi:hypothetical protein [Mycobacterium sp. DL592]|uniref:hypothetical protein n=1 Tax=Mycobacterium sp. DL592 TaxID=2675524 RepID=UPI00142061BA|nr:hypothetical protein [Mycobacterium sp. DL592]